jgi:hypothetical protein
MQSNQNMTDIDNKKDDNLGKQLLCLLTNSLQCVRVHTVSECIQVLKQGKLPTLWSKIKLNNTEIQAICELIEMSELNNKIAQFVLYNIIDECPKTLRMCYVIKHCNDIDSLKKILQYHTIINVKYMVRLYIIDKIIELGYNDVMYHGYCLICEHNKNRLSQELIDYCERGVQLGNVHCMLTIIYNVMFGKNFVNKYTKKEAVDIFMKGLQKLNNLKYNFEKIQPKITDDVIMQTYIINCILSECNNYEKYDMCEKMCNLLVSEDTKNLKNLIKKRMDIIKENIQKENDAKNKEIEDEKNKEIEDTKNKEKENDIQILKDKVDSLTLLLEKMTVVNNISPNISNNIQDIISKKKRKF